MRVLRSLANIALWTGAIVGVLSAGLWAANRAGLVQPVVVVSGSMEPGIMTGDLLFTARVPATELRVGDVATLRSAHTGSFVTHRVVATESLDDTTVVRMRGDANQFVDDETYVLAHGTHAWRHVLTIPGGGAVATALSSPEVARPLLIAFVAVALLMLLPPPKPNTGVTQPGADEPTPSPMEHSGHASWMAPILLAASLSSPLAGQPVDPPPVAFAITIQDVAPGVPAHLTGNADLARRAVLQSFHWTERTGVLSTADLDVMVCAADTCISASPDGSAIPLPPGTLDVHVTATPANDIPQGARGTAIGTLVFAADSQGTLPTTGADTLTTLLWGAAALAAGVLLVRVARERTA